MVHSCVSSFWEQSEIENQSLSSKIFQLFAMVYYKDVVRMTNKYCVLQTHEYNAYEAPRKFRKGLKKNGAVN